MQRSSDKVLNTDAQGLYSWDGRHGAHFCVNLSWSSARALGHELGNRGIGNSTMRDAWVLPSFSPLSILLSMALSGQERKQSRNYLVPSVLFSGVR